MDPINIPQMVAYIPYMDPMGYDMIYFNVTCAILDALIICVQYIYVYKTLNSYCIH